MYMMFIYIDKKVYNSMGIRNSDLEVLYQKAAEVSKEALEKNPRATIEVKVTPYI